MSKLTVTLNWAKLVDITNDMNDEFSGEKPSQGYLEFLLFSSIRKTKGIDFFAEEEKIANQEAKDRDVARRDMEREIYLRCDEEDREELEKEINEGIQQEAMQDTLLNPKL